MKELYKRTLGAGQEIFIPDWPVDVALENLAQAGKILGTENIINISELNQASAIVALMSAESPKQAAALIKHFICQVRIDGSKIETATINNMFEGKLELVLELFTHVIHSQFHAFFKSGLAKDNSQEQPSQANLPQCQSTTAVSTPS